MMVDYWDRTVTYAERGIVKLSDVPIGESTDFMAHDRYLKLLGRVTRSIDRAHKAGYTSLIDAVMKEHNAALTAGNNAPAGECAKVTIQIKQTATIVRIGFDALLELNNGGKPEQCCV